MELLEHPGRSFTDAFILVVFLYSIITWINSISIILIADYIVF